MKSKFGNFILFITMIALVAAILIFGFAMYLNITNKDLVITNVSNLFSSIMNTITSEESNSIKETVSNELKTDKLHENNYYYSQLTETQKKIYDGLQENKENMKNGTYQIQYGDVFTNILKQEGGSEKLGQDYQSAVECFLYDNPDVFYVDANKLFLSIETSKTLFKTTYSVYVGPADTANFFPNGFTSEEQVATAIKRINILKNNIISNLTGNTYKDILNIHDYLVESISYDSNHKSIGTYSVYGALIDKKCVCEGYAKALKYLLNQANISCEIVQGTATNSSGKTESHAWNAVKLNDNWYYIDTTWDDPIIIGQGSIAKSTQYKYFLKGSNTLNKDHTLSYQFSDNGRTYKYPKVEEYNYRHTR